MKNPKMSLTVLALSALISVSSAFASVEMDGAYLDPRYSGLKHPVVDDLQDKAVPKRSSVARAIALQTSVKAQLNRGTCSIFSATALLETLLVKKGVFTKELDLSEEWLQYLVGRTSTDDGSTSTANFRAFAKYGTAEEEFLPYIGESWEDASFGEAAERCGELNGRQQASCLIAHRDPRLLTASGGELNNPSSPLYDPEFLKVRTRAADFRETYLTGLTGGVYVGSVREAKALLRRNIPLTLDIDFFYGAWNHRLADELGIKRNMDHWARGIVGYPEEGSKDIVASQEKPAGHSVVVVGYDDEAVVTTRVLMEDSTTEEFTYKGVYYFKNSWGTGSFGSRFEINGVNHAGYGVITQAYSHDYGQFYRLPLE